MTRSRRLLLFQTVLLLATISATLLAFGVRPASFAVETARSADRFVDSICVGTHWSYPDTPYGQRYEEVKQKLIASGIRNVRDGFYQSRPQDLGKSGIRTTIVADVPDRSNGDEKTIQAIVNQIKTANAAGARIDAVEGSNEPDLFWIPSRFDKQYKGQGFPKGVIAFQKDLYTAIKRDSKTASLKVIGPSLGMTYDPGGGNPNPLPKGSLANAVDWGNFHPYPGGNPFSFPFDYNTTAKYYWNSNFPSINIDEFPYNFDTYSPPFQPKPMATTETGYSTFKQWVSEKVHAKYMPRLFLEFFRKNVQRTCSYEFVDEFADPQKTKREANFGLLRHDLTPKPAYNAVKNLIALLRDPGANFTPSGLAYSLDVRPVQNYREPLSKRVANYDRTQYVHHVLLQKRDRTFYLVLWHEVSNNDTSVQPPREIQPPALPVTLKLGQPIRTVAIYALGEDGRLTTTPTRLTSNQLTLNVPDRVVIVKLVPA
ncbi:hypothetical protein C7B82_11370 [Stenomitos frigidus ULC18]|uniref:Uncharacterized protein n=2 Tax=Stenomitos TaxID=1844270 RepID=A0A2T1E9T1_9CYAN|nr:hypothetical protein C7B82_11370 [Stenomitos frigidus ULC18]